MEPTHAGTSTTLPWLGGYTVRGSKARAQQQPQATRRRQDPLPFRCHSKVISYAFGSWTRQRISEITNEHASIHVSLPWSESVSQP
jgi:hypothetical protein